MTKPLQLVRTDLSATFDYCGMAKYSAGTTPPLIAQVTHLAHYFHALGKISKMSMPDLGIGAAPRNHHYGLANYSHSHRYIENRFRLRQSTPCQAAAQSNMH
jgi:hypothetical protein